MIIMNRINNIAINSKYIAFFYLFSFGIAWLFWWPMALEHLNIIETHIPLIIGQSIGAFAPFLSVLIISKIRKDKELFINIFILWQ